jgi:hypothetical protein
MQVFEFHFNPKGNKDVIFDSFCYEPENVYEKRLGSLYMAGSLKHTLPQNLSFLDNLAKLIKEKYYKTVSATPEKSLRETLRKTNEFLEKIAKGGDVSWLGNLSFAVISLKNHELNFTKVGDLKIFLLRKGQAIDIDQKLKFEDIEPYPLKIFGNIVSGKLAENDIILVLTKEVSEFLQNQNLITEIANLLPFEQKKLKEIFNSKKEHLAKISGICLLIVLTKETLAKEKETITPQKTFKIFSFKEIFSPLVKVKRFKLLKILLKKSTLKIPQIKFRPPKLKLKLPRPKLKIRSFFLGNKITLVLTLALFLALGFFIFKKLEEKELKVYQTQLNQIEEKVNLAQTYLIIAEGNPQAKKNANSLFKESWRELSPLVNIASTFPPNLANQVLTLKDEISKNLSQINKLEIVKEPQLIFEFTPREFIPQKMVYFKENLYFFSPYSHNVFEVNQKREGKILSINKKFNSAVSLTNSIVFFSKPDQLIIFKDNDFQETIILEPPYSDFNFNDLSSFQSNLYFLDKNSGKIIKYPYQGNLQWALPQLWLENKKAKDFRSLAVDGSIWILTKNNSIERYYSGYLQETLDLEIFPTLKLFSKLFTTAKLPYLYILEPVQKRIIILNKSGQIFQQYQSEKFDNLLDFTVSQDGKTIYLLNGLKVYRISLF